MSKPASRDSIAMIAAQHTCCDTAVDCGNLFDLLRLGTPAEGLIGIELSPERVAAARHCLPCLKTHRFVWAQKP